MSKNIDGKYQNMIIDNTKLIEDIESYINEKLEDYITSTDYASINKGGVIKLSGTYKTSISSGGVLKLDTVQYIDYNSLNSSAFISKGTLDNVITGKKLDPTSFTGYDATKTQVLKNIEGTLTWVDES